METHEQKCSRLLKQRGMYETQVENRHFCKADFDQSLCWNFTKVDSFAYQPCPFQFCGHCELSSTVASRYCQNNGTWSVTNYDSCIEIWLYNRSCIATPCNPCLDYFKLAARVVTLILSFLSTVCLLGSFALFSAFKSLQCMRISIHKNLCIALILRFVATSFWISLQWSGFFAGCLGFVTQQDWLCKFILFCVMYSTCASAYWTLVEGIYLAGKISILALKSDVPCIFYTLVGWGIPLLCVVSWGTFMELSNAKPCWMPYSSSSYRWILIVPILAALLTNLILLLTIIIILVKKLNASYVREPHKVRKATKAALLLAPLLGITNLFFFLEPSNTGNISHKVYIMGNAVMQHSQGIFLAVIYCFFNSEMRHLVIKRYLNMQRVNGYPAKRRSFKNKTRMDEKLNKIMITEVLLGANIQLSKIVVPIARK